MVSKKQVAEKITLVRGWYEGGTDAQVIEELAAKWVETEGELLAYRQSGALEALKAAEPALWILAASGNKDAAEKHRAILATIAKLEAM